MLVICFRGNKSCFIWLWTVLFCPTTKKGPEINRRLSYCHWKNCWTLCYLHTTVLITECQIQLFHWTSPSHGNTAMLWWLCKKTDFMFIAVFWGCCLKYSPRCLLKTPLKHLDASHFFLSKAIILGLHESDQVGTNYKLLLPFCLE